MEQGGNQGFCGNINPNNVQPPCGGSPSDGIGACESSDLNVQFDISYANGTTQSHCCGTEAYEFDAASCIQPKLTPEEMGIYCNDIGEEEEEAKWGNCQEEWQEGVMPPEGIPVCGTIDVYAVLGCETGTRLKGVKVNLYKITGLCPELVQTCVTDCDGKASFINVPAGSYRVVEILDKNYFNKPRYIKWNEVTISESNTYGCIIAVNTIKGNNCCR